MSERLIVIGGGGAGISAASCRTRRSTAGWCSPRSTALR